MVIPHAQAGLLNFEDVLRDRFGPEFGLTDSLSVPLQLSGFRDPGVLESRKRLYAALPIEVQAVLSRADSAPPELLSDPTFILRVAFIPAVPASGRNPDAVAYFVRPGEVPDERADSLERYVVVPKPRRSVAQFRPKYVCAEVSRRTRFVFHYNHHAPAARKLGAWPATGEPDGTVDALLAEYNSAFKGWLYSQAWIGPRRSVARRRALRRARSGGNLADHAGAATAAGCHFRCRAVRSRQTTAATLPCTLYRPQTSGADGGGTVRVSGSSPLASFDFASWLKGLSAIERTLRGQLVPRWRKPHRAQPPGPVMALAPGRLAGSSWPHSGHWYALLDQCSFLKFAGRQSQRTNRPTFPTKPWCQGRIPKQRSVLQTAPIDGGKGNLGPIDRPGPCLRAILYRYAGGFRAHRAGSPYSSGSADVDGPPSGPGNRRSGHVCAVRPVGAHRPSSRVGGAYVSQDQVWRLERRAAGRNRRASPTSGGGQRTTAGTTSAGGVTSAGGANSCSAEALARAVA